MSTQSGSSFPNKLYVQFGCGLRAPDLWLNFDASPRLRFESLPLIGIVAATIGKRLFPKNVKYGDIVFGLPVQPGSCCAVYASHVLEHLSRQDVVVAVANTFKILQPGGVFRMIVPDLESRARQYVAAVDNGEDDAADKFIESCNIGETRRHRGGMALLRSTFGHSGHMWMYDFAQLSSVLKAAGFVKIRRCDFNDSGDEMFALVEDRGRFYDAERRELALECRKP